MTYYPKKMVNTGLYASKGEFSEADTGKEYEGFYHETFNGKTFSGKDPLDPNRKLLTKSSTFGQDTNITSLDKLPEGLSYEGLGNTKGEIYRFGEDPISYTPRPTGEDYKRGQIIRYFAKKRNETPIRIVEINKEVYDDLSSRNGTYNYALWSILKLFWKITGPLYDSKDQYGVLTAGIVNTNERLREEANQNMRGIKQYLSNTIQFSVKPDLTLVTNQYTSGNEFTVKQDNSDYIGSYHTMADGTIMDGADMSQTTNKTLLAGNVLVQNRINTLVKDELGKLGAS